MTAPKYKPKKYAKLDRRMVSFDQEEARKINAALRSTKKKWPAWARSVLLAAADKANALQ
jgi:hypothetical protein